MKRILPITLTLILQFASSAQNPAQQADDSYRAGNYQEAIVMYEQVLASGQSSANLYYNLGNAYYREQQMGRAILNYERALRLSPGMDEARENLTLAQSHTTDRITQLPKLFLVKWWDGLTKNILPAAWRIIWIVLLLLLAASVVVFALGTSERSRKWGLVAGLVSLALLLFSTATLLSSTARFNAHADAIVMEPVMPMKGSPEQQSIDKMVLHEGTRVHISESLSGWHKIVIADGTTGWCETASIERI